MNFNDYNWHDAQIKLITIDRNNPGINDEISFSIGWENGDKSKLIFSDVYKIQIDMNLGIVAEETILDARMLNRHDDSNLKNLYSNWKGLIDDVRLDTYLIRLNSTNGVIMIVAKQFVVDGLTTKG